MNRSSGDTSVPLTRMSAEAPRPREVRMRYVAQARFLRPIECSGLRYVGPYRNKPFRFNPQE
jgi:hypothetical protein